MTSINNNKHMRIFVQNYLLLGQRQIQLVHSLPPANRSAHQQTMLGLGPPLLDSPEQSGFSLFNTMIISLNDFSSGNVGISKNTSFHLLHLEKHSDLLFSRYTIGFHKQLGSLHISSNRVTPRIKLIDSSDDGHSSIKKRIILVTSLCSNLDQALLMLNTLNTKQCNYNCTT